MIYSKPGFFRTTVSEVILWRHKRLTCYCYKRGIVKVRSGIRNVYGKIYSFMEFYFQQIIGVTGSPFLLVFCPLIIQIDFGNSMCGSIVH